MYIVATTTISTICGNYFTQYIPLHIPRRSQISPSHSTIFLIKRLKIKDIQLGVAGQTFEVSISTTSTISY